MSVANSAVTVYVTYQGTPQDRFDRGYYETSHLPLVTAAWQPYGLMRLTVFYPSVERAGTLAICECVFRDEAALTAALASPDMARVMADLPRFTDLQPSRLRAEVL